MPEGGNEMTIMHTVSGEAIDVLPVGTRVRHKRFPDLLGTIARHEFHESGAISPIPYYVCWDSEARARLLLDGMFWYADNDQVKMASLIRDERF